MAGLIQQNYAEALFMLATENNSVREFKEQLQTSVNIFSDLELKQVMDHPNVLKEEKQQLVVKLLNVDRLIKNFLMILVDKNRFSLLSDIFVQYNVLANKSLGIKDVVLTSAKPLSDEELQQIIDVMAKKLNSEIEVKTLIDESLLAGIKVDIDGIVYDNTALSKLVRIKNKVDNITLKQEV